MQPTVLEPLAVKVTRYLCPHCGRGRSTKRAAVLHMPKCWRNPDLHGCKSCALFQPGVWPGKPVPGGKAPGRCGAGYNLNKGLVTKCRKWRAAPQG
jgi:hypothetical protein